MFLNEITDNKGARKARRRIGRGIGSGRGKTAGKGHKGQKARSGGRIHRWFEGGQMPLQRRVPKRGFRRHGRTEFQTVDIEGLATLPEGTVVTKVLLREKNLIKSATKKTKLLGDGTLTVALTVQLDAASKSAMEKIQQAGGKIELPTTGA